MTPKAVLFDCDGVLVDSEPPVRSLLQLRLRDAGLDLTLAELNTLFLGGTLAGFAKAAKARGARLPDNWVPETYAIIYDLLKSVAPIPGVHDLLDQLDEAGIGIAVCSNGPMEKMKVSLTATGLWDRLSSKIYSAHKHGPAKPSPDLYLLAAKNLGCDPEECVIIEDSPTGARAAKAAGIRCLGLALDTDAEALRRVGAEPIYALSEVPARIGM